MSNKLNIGEIIKTGDDIWEVISISDKTATIKVLGTGELIARYLDIGKEYLLKYLMSFGDMDDWEIPSSTMKRQVSQVILQIEGDRRTIDLEF